MTKDEHYRITMDFIRGRPSRRLLWSLDAGPRCFTAVCGDSPSRAAVADFREQLGCIQYWHGVAPYDQVQKNVEVKTLEEGGDSLNEYISPWGALRERKRGKSCIEYMIKTPDDVRTFIGMCEDTEITPNPDRAEYGRSQAEGRCPLAMRTRFSPVQELFQYTTGVTNFYYLLTDHPALMEQLMEVMQALQRARYEIMIGFPCDVFLQGENTSTTMISPAYYEKYSLLHVGEFVSYARKAGVPAFVHMCGLLHGLLPLIKRTGMDGIHSLTPPPVGDVPFEEFYKQFPPDFPILGRLGSVHWVGKTQDRILGELKKLVPRRILQEHPFMLWVTADGVEALSERNFMALKAAIEAYNAGE